MNLTIRNIPDAVLGKIKAISKRERRSLNSQILVVLEEGLKAPIIHKPGLKISKGAQIGLWQNLSGEWKDDRDAGEISADILKSRTEGRHVDFDSD